MRFLGLLYQHCYLRGEKPTLFICVKAVSRNIFIFYNSALLQDNPQRFFSKFIIKMTNSSPRFKQSKHIKAISCSKENSPHFQGAQSRALAGHQRRRSDVNIFVFAKDVYKTLHRLETHLHRRHEVFIIPEEVVFCLLSCKNLAAFYNDLTNKDCWAALIAQIQYACVLSLLVSKSVRDFFTSRPFVRMFLNI